MKKITTLTTLLLLLIAANAQDCKTAMLTTKGMELEYHNTLPRFGMFGKPKEQGYKITTLTFQVTDVKDSNGVTYSYIHKKGTSSKKENFVACQGDFVVTCDGKNITLPVNFYAVDTIFLCDIYGGGGKKAFYMVQELTTPANLVLPVTMKEQDELTPFSYDFKLVMNDPEKQRMENFVSGSHHGGSPYTRIEGTVSVKKLVVTGRQEITVAAGTFDCFKIMVTANMEGAAATYIEYYAPGIGIVRIDYATGANTELVRVTKK